MKNFIFKSSEGFGLIKNVSNKLEVIQNEQRHQRLDMAAILYLLKKVINDDKLQKQVDDFHDDCSPQDKSDLD